jgi:predicted metal-dependent hydrolase
MAIGRSARRATRTAGVRLFRAGRFHEAHDAFEALWNGAAATDRPVYQAMVQLAAAGVHLERGRPAPARILLRRARERLAHAGAAAEQCELPVAWMVSTIADRLR